MEPPNGTGEQCQAQQYFQNDAADFERHIEHETAGGNQGRLNDRRGRVRGDLPDENHDKGLAEGVVSGHLCPGDGQNHRPHDK